MGNELSYDQFTEIKKHEKLIKKMVRLTRKKRKLSDQIKAVNEELDAIASESGSLTDVFVNNGITKIPGVDGMTVYIKKSVYAGLADGEDKKEVFKILENNGLDHLITAYINSQSFGKWLKESVATAEDMELSINPESTPMVSFDDVLPDDLKGKLKISEVFKLVGKEI